MSRLYASIDSDARKTQATSRGHHHISTHTRGWDVGVLVVADTTGDEDVFRVYATGGSNGASGNTLIATITADDIRIGAATYKREHFGRAS